MKDGKLAIDFLNRAGQYENAETPDLILLDINLPKKSGYEILECIKNSEHLKHKPFIMRTTSSSEGDFMECIRLGGNGYLTKPFEIAEFKKYLLASRFEIWKTN